MWQNWINVVLGLALIAFALVGGLAAQYAWTIGIAGALVAIFAAWSVGISGKSSFAEMKTT